MLNVTGHLKGYIDYEAYGWDNECERGQAISENEHVKALLLIFYSDMSDSEITKKLGVYHSTVRHQKFTSREKSKQAKLYLAVFESVFKDMIKNEEAIIPIHNHAMYYDDRYVITEQEKTYILKRLSRVSIH